MQIVKEELKWPVCRNIIKYVEILNIPPPHTKSVRINEFNKVTGWKPTHEGQLWNKSEINKYCMISLIYRIWKI